MQRKLHYLLTLTIIALLLLILAPSAASQGSSGTSPQCSTPPGSIWVFLQNFLSEWPFGTNAYQNPAMEDYTYGVVMGELGPSVPQGPYVGQTWDGDVLRAQSVAARTWGSYWCRRRVLGNGQSGVYDGATDQVYRPYRFGDPEKTRFQNISGETKAVHISWDGLLLEAPYNGVLLDAQYRRDVGNPSMTTSEQSSWGAYQYLKSVNNPYTIGFDDGVGWAQTQSQGWRNTYNRGAGYPQLLQQYYTGVYLQNQGYTVFNEYFYNNANCSGSPVYAGTTNSINYDWGNGAPPNRNVGSDYFCAVWFQNITVDAADWYTFYIIGDDGFKLWIDNAWVLDRWVIQGPTQYTLSLYLTAGTHFLYLQYFENTGMSVIRSSWQRGTGMIGEYYDSVITKTGNPTFPIIMVRSDIPIKFDWDVYSPLDTRQAGVSRIIEDTFSMRWQGRIYIETCKWVNFVARTDDGVYLKIFHDPYGGAEEVMIDAWYDQGPTYYYYSRWLCPGTYRLEARYYENGGGALISISW